MGRGGIARPVGVRTAQRTTVFRWPCRVRPHARYIPGPSPSLSSPISLPSSCSFLHRRQKPALLTQQKHTFTQTMAASVACSFFFDAEPESEHGMPALDACALCAKPLARDSDIYMYRGDTPFCSEDCRDEQMQLDAVYVRQAARRPQRYSSGTAACRGHQESRKVSVAS
ncbi:unnamed protein product [Alopecurus aequalis]